MKFTINEFIDYTEQNKLKFISYCEVIIDRYGNIILSNPCHIETVIRYIMEKDNITRDQIDNEIPFNCMPLEWCIDKYGLVAVWYSGYMYSTYKKINRFQKRSLDILIKHGLITESYVQPANEYTLYLKRRSMGLPN